MAYQLIREVKMLNDILPDEPDIVDNAIFITMLVLIPVFSFAALASLLYVFLAYSPILFILSVLLPILLSFLLLE